jgi:hypothetical protein
MFLWLWYISHVLLPRFNFFYLLFCLFFQICDRIRMLLYKSLLEFVSRRSFVGLLEVTRTAAPGSPGPALHSAVDWVSRTRVLWRYNGSSDCVSSTLPRANAIRAPPGTYSVSTKVSHRDWLQLFQVRIDVSVVDVMYCSSYERLTDVG